MTMADTAATSDNSIRFDISYVKTIPGLLKAGVILSSLLGLICNAQVYYARFGMLYLDYPFGGWYYFHATTSMITSTILLILYLVRIPWVVTIIMWYLSELIYCALFGIFSVIGALGSLISIATHYPPYVSNVKVAAKIFAAIFAAGTAGCLGYDALLKLKAHQRGEVGPAKTRQTAASAPI